MSKFYAGFNFQPRYFYHFAVSLVVRLLQSLMMAGLFWLAVTALLAISVAIRRKQLTG